MGSEGVTSDWEIAGRLWLCVYLRGGGCGDPLARIAGWVIRSQGAAERAPAGGKSAEELAAAASSKASEPDLAELVLSGSTEGDVTIRWISVTR